jgi:TRAP-type uncharacterized transport system substrate-binding protein
MSRVLSRALLSCCLALAAPLSLSEEEATESAPAVVLSSGVEGGGYWNAGARLQAVAAKAIGLGVENLPSTGSLNNIEQLLDETSPVNLGFAQADAVQLYLNKNPRVIENLVVLENIGPECVFIVAGANGSLRTDADLRSAKNLRLGIPSASSGIAVTFDYMASQMPELGRASVVYGDTLAAMETMDSDNPVVDAVMMVHRPREHSPEVDNALAHPERFRLVELDDERFTAASWNGKPVYRQMDLAMPEMDEPLQTICVVGLLLANKHKLSSEQRNQLGDLVDFHWMEIYPTE